MDRFDIAIDYLDDMFTSPVFLVPAGVLALSVSLAAATGEADQNALTETFQLQSLPENARCIVIAEDAQATKQVYEVNCEDGTVLSAVNAEQFEL